MGSPVELPCPISGRATRMRTLLSGLTTIHAVSSRPVVLSAAAAARAGIINCSARPPPAAVDALRKSRRDLRNGIIMMDRFILPFGLRDRNMPYAVGNL